MQAAWAARCHLILVPRYQMVDDNWDLNHEAFRIGIKVQRKGAETCKDIDGLRVCSQYY